MKFCWGHGGVSFPLGDAHGTADEKDDDDDDDGDDGDDDDGGGGDCYDVRENNDSIQE